MSKKLESELVGQIEETNDKESWWWKRGRELAQLEKHPLHQSRLKKIRQEKEQLEQYGRKYKGKYKELKASIDDKIEIYRYGKGANALHRGVLCPSKISSEVDGNVKRGRLLKNYSETVDYIYGFNKDNQLCKVQTNDKISSTEYIIYENGMEIGLLYDMDEILDVVSVCSKKDGRLISYQCASTIEENGTFFKMYSEKYDYISVDKVLVIREELVSNLYNYFQFEISLDEEGNATTYTNTNLIGDKIYGDIFHGKFDSKVNFLAEKNK